MDIAMNEPPSSGTRWVCPSDRHLALRAKLRTGWSVKTGSFDSRWNNYSNTSTAGSSDRCGQSFVLTEEEQRTIIQVIQRAEALDLSEQKRIGKLVERLEDMKRNVRIITSSRSDEKKSCGSRCFGGVRCVCSCALCGEKFGTVLGASPLLCKDCRKYVCQKCGREAGSLNNSATSTSVEGSTSAAASEGQQQKRTAMQRIVRRSGNNAQKLFLCRICAESREIWKKSGAWFFKGMPKHDLPKKKERDWSRTGQKGANQPSNRSIGACKSLDSTDAQDSSSDEDVARRLSNARSTSATSPSQENNNNIDNSSFSNNNNASKCTSPAASSASSSQNALSPGTSSSRSPKTRSDGLSPPAQREESFSSLGDKLSKSNLSIPSQCNRLSPSASAVTLRSQQQHPSLEESASVEEQVLKHAGDVVPHYTADCNDRCKGSQAEFAEIAQPTDGTDSRRSQETRKRCTVRFEQDELDEQQRRAQQYLVRPQRGPDETSNVARSDEIRDGGKLWDSGSLIAIRPSGSVPPVQSAICAGPKAYGHPRPHRSILQAEHLTGGNGHGYQTHKNEDSSQDSRSHVQRNSEFPRNERCRYEERTSPARVDPTRRPMGRRLSRGGEIPPFRVGAFPDEALQSAPSKSLPSESRRRSLGYAHGQQRSNTDHPDLLYPQAGFNGHHTSGYESFTHGQQRVF